MTEMIITKIIAKLDDFPTEVLQKVRDAMAIELGQYDITPKTTDLVIYTGIPQLLKLFIASKKVDGASRTTLGEYTRNLSKFLARLQKDPVKVTTSDIRMYLAIRESEGLKRSSLSTLGCHKKLLFLA